MNGLDALGTNPSQRNGRSFAGWRCRSEGSRIFWGETAAHHANAKQALRIITLTHVGPLPQRAPLFSAAKFFSSTTTDFLSFKSAAQESIQNHSHAPHQLYDSGKSPSHGMKRKIPGKSPSDRIKRGQLRSALLLSRELRGARTVRKYISQIIPASATMELWLSGSDSGAVLRSRVGLV